MPRLRRRNARRGGRLELPGVPEVRADRAGAAPAALRGAGHPRRMTYARMSGMSLNPRDVTTEAFARMLADGELRKILGVDLSQGSADAVLSSPELLADYYRRWSDAAVMLQGTGATQPHSDPPARRSNAVRPSARSTLGMQSAVQGVIWAGASLVLVGLTLTLAIALARSDDPNLGQPAAIYWTQVGLFFAILLCVWGLMHAVRATRFGGSAEVGTPRKTATIVLGVIGLIANVFFALSWILTWVTL